MLKHVTIYSTSMDGMVHVKYRFEPINKATHDLHLSAGATA